LPLSRENGKDNPVLVSSGGKTELAIYGFISKAKSPGRSALEKLNRHAYLAFGRLKTVSSAGRLLGASRSRGQSEARKSPKKAAPSGVGQRGPGLVSELIDNNYNVGLIGTRQVEFVARAGRFRAPIDDGFVRPTPLLRVGSS
jgi:hypothetical protein